MFSSTDTTLNTIFICHVSLREEYAIITADLPTICEYANVLTLNAHLHYIASGFIILKIKRKKKI